MHPVFAADRTVLFVHPGEVELIRELVSLLWQFSQASPFAELPWASLGSRLFQNPIVDSVGRICQVVG